MRIVFTQFTPPFEHGMSEEEYLRYDDWFAKLRRAFAATDEVVFLSLTKKKKLISLEWDNYLALFFPVDNPQEGRQREGRLWYTSQRACNWLREYRPDIVHVIGTGSEMAARVLETAADSLSFLWERCTVTDRTLASRELALCDYYVHPTQQSLERALPVMSGDRLLLVPLGTDTETFRPLAVAKEFDIVSVGRLTPSKQFDALQRVVVKHNLSWLHAGGYVKGPPYGKWEDYRYSRHLQRLGLGRGPKRSASGKMVSGRFPHQEMPNVYNRARLMVHPSRGEGAARAVQEALACAVPVVVLKDVVPWVEADFGMALDDVSQLERSVMELLANAEHLQKMGERGRNWLIAHHAFNHLAETVRGYHDFPKPTTGRELIQPAP